MQNRFFKTVIKILPGGIRRLGILLVFLALLVSGVQARQSVYLLVGERVDCYSMTGVFQESFQLNPYPQSQTGYVGLATDGFTVWASHSSEYDFITGEKIREGGQGHAPIPIYATEGGYCGGLALNGNGLYLGRDKHWLETNPTRVETYSISAGAYSSHWYMAAPFFTADSMQYANGKLVCASSTGGVRIYETDGDLVRSFDVSYLYPGNGLTALCADATRIYVQFYNIGTNKAFAFDWDGNREATDDIDFPVTGLVRDAYIAWAPDVPILMPVPDSVVFGQLLVSTETSQQIAVTNVGVQDLHVTGVALADGTHFGLVAPTTPFALTPGESTGVTVSFTPGTTGNLTDNLVFTSDSKGPAGSETVVPLAGDSVAAVVYVDALASGTGSGESWTHAFTSIGAALAASSVLDGASLWVREGTYGLTETITVNKSVQIYGGFPRGVSNPGWGDRDWESHPSVIDGNNACLCVMITASATVDGLTITGGNNLNSWPDDYAGGIFVKGIKDGPEVHAAIANCTINNNRGPYGGGIWKNYYVTSCTINNCTVSDNEAEYWGGGLGVSGPNAVITDCRITNNQTTSNRGMGGGVYITNGGTDPPVFTNCFITGNRAGYSGGGVYNENRTSSSFINCVIADNELFGQESYEYGGSGIAIRSESAVTMTNCTIVDNRGYGAGVYKEYAEGVPVLTNCILWGNQDAEIYLQSGAVVNVFDSDIDQDGYGGAAGAADANGNIRVPPRLKDPEVRDYSLAIGSPCIDAGTSDNAPDTDLAGVTRPQGDGVDIGAYEYDGIVYNGPWYVDGDISAAGDGMTWGGAFQTLEEAISTAGPGEEIWVKAGRFLLGDTIRLDKAVKLYGGFSGVGSERDWNRFPSILDGQGQVFNCIWITADATIDGFEITGGNANGEYPYSNGGGIYNETASPIIRHCLFSENRAWEQAFNMGSGGAIYSTYYSENQLLNGNIPRALISDCVFINNFAYFRGAAYCGWVDESTFENCLFIGNRGSSISYCQGWTQQSVSPEFINCTFADNRIEGYGGALINNYSNTVVTNCIFWGNGTEIGGGAGSSPVITYNDIEGGYSGTGNLNVAPAFKAPGSWDDNGTTGDTADDVFVVGDYHLTPDSDCIDAGTASGAPDTDFDGAVRPQGGDVDMGAYEYYDQSDIGVTPARLDMAVVWMDPGVEESLTVGNDGVLDLIISGITIGDTEQFSLDFDSLPIALAPGETTEIRVTFSPPDAGLYDTLVTIESNDPDETVFPVPVRGQGVDPVFYILSVTIAGQGSVDLNPPGGTYREGTEVTLTPVPDADCGFAGWSGPQSTDDNPLIVTMNSDQSWTATFFPDADADGITDTEEYGPEGTDPGYDGNGDGTADGQQGHVVSTHTADGSEYVTVAAESGAALENLTVAPMPAEVPEGYDFPFGLIGFDITGLTTGQATTVDIVLPDGTAPLTYYQRDPISGDWYEFLYDGTTGAEFAGNVITLHFVDGARGDHDAQANGTISDPGGPAELEIRTFSLQLYAGWNLISLPVVPVDNTIGGVFGNFIQGPPWLWDGNAGLFMPVVETNRGGGTFIAMRGYVVYAPVEVANLEVSGYCPQNGTPALGPGLIVAGPGETARMEVPPELQSVLWWYDASRHCYEPVAETRAGGYLLETTRAYWFRLSAPAEIRLGPSRGDVPSQRR